MGFADMLTFWGVAYNSDEGVAPAEKLMAFVQAEDKASQLLARERGPFPFSTRAPTRRAACATPPSPPSPHLRPFP